MLFRTECGENWEIVIIYLDDAPCSNARIKASFDKLIKNLVSRLELEYIPHRRAYRTNEEEQKFLEGAAEGFVFAVNYDRGYKMISSAVRWGEW